MNIEEITIAPTALTLTREEYFSRMGEKTFKRFDMSKFIALGLSYEGEEDGPWEMIRFNSGSPLNEALIGDTEVLVQGQWTVVRCETVQDLSLIHI